MAEPEVVLASNIPEKLVCCLWFESRWRPERLETLDGRQFTVHSPGQWNRQAGPDFLQAVLEYRDGERCRGDVEVHRFASGWTAHHHHQDTRYNRVILHVVLQNDRASHSVQRADGQLIPQVTLEPLLSRPLATYRDAIPLEDYPNKHVPRIGQCYTTLRALPLHDVQQFLERAGEARLQKRMRRWSQRAASVGLAQAMYEAVFRSLGSAGYRQRFSDMAHRLPWQEIQPILSDGDAAERSLVSDALLFGISGLLQRALAHSHTMDEESQTYLSKLHRVWTRLPGEIHCLAEKQTDWRHPHVRPMNTPERRLAGMAQLMAQSGKTDLYHAALARCQPWRERKPSEHARSLHRELIGMFELPMHAYWGARARFGSRSGRLQQRLIGRQRALTMVVDAVLPVLLGQACTQGDSDLQQVLLAAYRLAPRLPDNTLLRDMSRRLLGGDPELLALVTHARHQQGMLQVFEDYCSHDEGGCQGCGFPQL
ncbi:DUF2851 family protein [Candidatus Entotheonella palauensis]|uniref:DUF2851 family protein n=1 Tax=Candidatus Entotheonella palauensis TaxID=93172 RepID=UPI0015C44806|nr:DUF2851 family protein [Candidatus Entotheonella palauensis]